MENLCIDEVSQYNIDSLLGVFCAMMTRFLFLVKVITDAVHDLFKIFEGSRNSLCRLFSDISKQGFEDHFY